METSRISSRAYRLFQSGIRSRPLRLGLSLAISAGLIYLAFHSVDLAQVWNSLSQAQPVWVLAGLVCTSLYTLLKIVRWQVLLGQSPRKVRLADTGAAFLAGQLIDLGAPGHIGELGRSYLLGSRGPGGFFVLGTVMLEKTLDFFCYSLLIGVTLLLVPFPVWLQIPATFLVACTLVLVPLVILAAYKRPRFSELVERMSRFLPGRMQEYLLSRFDRLLSGLQILHSRPSLVLALLISVGIWAGAALLNGLLLRAVQLDLGVSAPLLLLVALQAGISFINTPGQIGVFEAIGMLVLGLYGVEPAVALSYSLLLHLIAVLPIVLGGGLAFWYLGSSKRERLSDQGRLD